jgi:cell division protein FtsQ
MARDSEAGAGANKSRRPRVSNAALDPNRSSMRRLSGRRPGNVNVRRPSVEVAGSPSIVPPRVSHAGDPASPRNRRVLRAAEQAKGPKLATRLWLWLFALASSSLRGARTLTASLSAQLKRRVAESEPGTAPSLSVDGEHEASAPAASPAMTRTLRIMGVLAMLAAGYGLSHFVQRHLTTAPAFAIDAIELKGLARLTRAELLHSAGIATGMNVFARSPEEIHARLLRHPWILSAEVKRELPSRIRITVRERDPIALLVVEACSAPVSKGGDDDPACDEASSLYLVSADAKMFKRMSGKEAIDLPVVTGITRQRLAADADLSRRVVTQAVGLMHEYRASDLWRRNPIGEIHLESNDGFSLYVGDDLTYVRLGAPPFAQKLSRMKKVFERLEHEHARAEYVYLDNEQRPDRVAVRLR